MSAVMSLPTSSAGFALQTRLFAGLKRTGRVIDIVWFQQDAEYARAVLTLAEKTGDEVLHEVVGSLRELMRDFLAPPRVAAVIAMPAPVVAVVEENPAAAPDLERYIGRLR